MQVIDSPKKYSNPSLVECPDCEGRVSRSAVMCPHCGRPFGRGDHNAVRVVDIDMKFGTMVEVLVKLAIATIPAALILAMIGGAVFVALTALTR